MRVFRPFLAFSLALAVVGCAGDDDDDDPLPSDDAPDGALITRENHAALVAHALDVYVGDLYANELHALLGLETRMTDLRVSRDTSSNPIRDVYACEDGGAELDLLYSGTNAGEIHDWRFDRCRFAGLVHDGELSLHRSGLGMRYRSPDLALRRGEHLVTRFSGTARWWFTQSRLGDSIRRWDTESLALDARTIDGDLTLADATSSFAYGADPGGGFDAWLRGGFELRSEITGGTTLRASTPVELRYRRERDDPDDPGNAWNFTEGQLELLAEDGSRVTLDAATGDPATVRVTIDGGQEPESFETPWTAWQRRLRFERYPLDAPGRIALPEALADATAGPAITPENHLALLDHAFDLFAGRAHAAALLLARDFLSTNEPAERTRDRGLLIERHDCGGGGTAVARRIDDDASGATLDFRLAFDACEVGDGYRLDGAIGGEEIRPRGGAQWFESDALVWTAPDGNETLFRGRVSVPRDEDARDGCRWSTEGVNLFGLAGDHDAVLTSSGEREHLFTAEGGGGNVVALDTAGTRFEASADAVTLEGALGIVSAASGGHALRVVAQGLSTEAAEGEARDDAGEAGGFVAGGLFMEAEDGSRLYLGDFVETPDAPITIVNRDGNFGIGSPWTSWRSRLDEDAALAVCGRR